MTNWQEVRKYMESNEKPTMTEAAKKFGIKNWREIWKKMLNEKWNCKQYDIEGTRRKFTFEHRGWKRIVIEALKNGMSMAQAYKLAGSPDAVLSRHRRNAEKSIEENNEECPYVKWWREMETAQAEFTNTMLRRIREAADTGTKNQSVENHYRWDEMTGKFIPERRIEKGIKNAPAWQAAAWLLKKMRRSEFSDTQTATDNSRGVLVVTSFNSIEEWEKQYSDQMKKTE